MAVTNIYFVITGDPSAGQYSDGIQSAETLRTSLDGTKSIMKLPYDTASEVGTAFEGVTTYTHAQILQFLSDNTADWNRSLG